MFVEWFAGYTGENLNQKIRDAFRQFDTDGNRTLDKEEFRQVRTAGKDTANSGLRA